MPDSQVSDGNRQRASSLQANGHLVRSQRGVGSYGQGVVRFGLTREHTEQHGLQPHSAREHRQAVTDISAAESFCAASHVTPPSRLPRIRRFYVRALTIDRPRSVTAVVFRPGSAASSSRVGRPVAAAADSAGSLRSRRPGRQAGRLGMDPAVVPGQPLVTHDEHAEPDIPGSRVADGAHGGGGMLMVTAVRGVDAAGCSWWASRPACGHAGAPAGARGQLPGSGRGSGPGRTGPAAAPSPRPSGCRR